mgnify:CR=1 FL=1
MRKSETLGSLAVKPKDTSITVPQSFRNACNYLRKMRHELSEARIAQGCLTEVSVPMRTNLDMLVSDIGKILDAAESLIIVCERIAQDSAEKGS